jgi:hypothetical protein
MPRKRDFVKIYLTDEERTALREQMSRLHPTLPMSAALRTSIFDYCYQWRLTDRRRDIYGE